MEGRERLIPVAGELDIDRVKGARAKAVRLILGR